MKCAFWRDHLQWQGFQLTSRQTTRPVFAAQLSTKPSTNLCAYFLNETGNLSLRAESGECMRGTTNVLGMTVPLLLLLFHPADSHQRCDKMLPYSDAAKVTNGQKVVYTILNGSGK